MLRNRLHAQEQLQQPDPHIVAAYEKLLQEFEAQIQSLEQQLQDLEDEAFEEQKKLLTSIKGIGPATAHWLLIYTNSMTDFTAAKQLVKFCGLSPRKHFWNISLALLSDSKEG